MQKIILFLGVLALYLPHSLWAQTNYQSGNINDCFTWAANAGTYTTIQNMSVKNGTTITTNTNVNGNSITLNGDGAVSFSGSNAFTLNSGGTDVKCGGIYGYYDGSKWHYVYSQNCFFALFYSNPSNRYIYSTITVTLGPMKRAGNYKFGTCKAQIYYKQYSGGCWTSDWNVRADWNSTNGLSDGYTYNIWNNRGDLQKTSSACDALNTYEQFQPGKLMNFNFTTYAFNAGDYVTVNLYLQTTSGSGAEYSNNNPPNGCLGTQPAVFLDFELTLDEQ